MSKEIKLLPAQAELYFGKRSEGKLSDYRGIYCGRAGGKSFILSLIACKHLIEGRNIMIFAQDYECLQKNLINPMIEFLDSWHAQYHLEGAAHNNITVTNLKGSSSICYGFTYENYEKARGRTKVATQIYDEIAQAPPDIFVATAACSRDCGYEPMTLFGSTPLKGTYWDKWVKQLKDEGYPIVTHGGIDENTHVTAAEKEQMKRAFQGMDEQFIRQELYGEIIDGDIKFQVFTHNCFNKPFTAPRGFVSMGIDVSGMGRDYNVFYVVDDTHIIDKFKVQKANTFELNAIARRLISKHNVELVTIDMTGGFGQGLYDMLSTVKSHCRVIGVNFGQRAKDKGLEGHRGIDKYANARAEMYFNAAELCKAGFSINNNDEELIEQLKSQQFEACGAGKVKLMEKELIKGMIGGSPDCSDAFCLALYMREGFVSGSYQEDSLYEGSLGF